MTKRTMSCPVCMGRGVIEYCLVGKSDDNGEITGELKNGKCVHCDGSGCVESVMIETEDFLQLMEDVSFLASTLHKIACTHEAIDDDELCQLGYIRERWGAFPTP